MGMVSSVYNKQFLRNKSLGVKKILFRGGVHQQFFWIFQLFQIVSHQCAGNDLQWQIWPKKWLRLGQNGHFCIFFYLFPQMRPRLLEMVNFTWFPTFPIFCQQSISFLEKSQKLSFLRGGTSANFLSFPTFSNRLTPMWLEMTHNGKFGQKSGLDWVKMAIFAYFSIFSPKWGRDYLKWSISPDSQLFPSFANKASHFWRNLKNYHF